MKKKKYVLKKYFNLNSKLVCFMCFYIALAVFVFMVVFEKWTISISLALCGLPLFVKKTKLWLKKKRQEATEAEFYVLLTQLSMAMSSGMSLENAIREAVVAGKKEYKILRAELEGMYRLLQNNYSPEYVFGVLAKKTENQEIKTFSEILSVGMPAGINMAGLMRWLTSAYRMKIDTESEISRILNAPKYNNRIILAMPVVCIVLFKQIAPSYMQPLYAGAGRIIMVFVVFVIALAWWLGEKISKIDY